MADTIQPPGDPQTAPTGRRESPAGPFFTLRVADVQLYRVCDDLSGMLIFPMLVFGPWAFGTTDPWSIWTMNVAGYALGILLFAKIFIRGSKGYTALRWENFSIHSATKTRHRHPLTRLLTRSLAGLTLAVLAFCLVSAWNARSTYNPGTRLFEYHHCLAWLPNSLDSHRTWFTFWTYLGLAASFWAVRDWLLGMTPAEERAIRNSEFTIRLPGRLRQMLWLLCINGALLGLECIIQRASGSGKLLFLVQPLVNPEGESQFGPYHYRSNAAQYFNLLWPVCLGFWWTLHSQFHSPQSTVHSRFSHHVLLFCAAIMAACPIISTSRAGALVAAGMLVLAVIFLAAFGIPNSSSAVRRSTFALLGFFVVLVLALGWHFGWDSLGPRMGQIGEGYQNREQMYDAAKPMAADYPIFGTGPGTFGSVFQLYLISSETYWPEQLHNDWLETRITFGWAGMALLLAALCCVALRWFAPGGIRGGRRFVVLIWLALAGCLLEARFDFPFQIYSILFLFLVFCAVLFSFSRRSGASRR